MDNPGRQNGQKGPRLQTASISDEGKDNNYGRHQRVEIRAAIISEKRRDSKEDSLWDC
jgi:hypothetical protein